MRLNFRWPFYREKRCEYLTAEDDPVLARIWDNEDDDIYDTDWIEERVPSAAVIASRYMRVGFNKLLGIEERAK